MITECYTLLTKLNFYQNADIIYFVFFEISCPAGLPHSPDLLRYQVFAVAYHSYTLDALHLRQMRQSQNLGDNFSAKPVYFKYILDNFTQVNFYRIYYFKIRIAIMKEPLTDINWKLLSAQMYLWMGTNYNFYMICGNNACKLMKNALV